MAKLMLSVLDSITEAMGSLSALMPYSGCSSLKEAVHQRMELVQRKLDLSNCEKTKCDQNELTSCSGFERDALALRSDWMKIGGDLRKAMNRYDRER